MAWELLAAQAGAALISGLIGGNSKRDAAIASNKEAKKLNKAKHERDTENWELGFLGLMSNYAWQMAETGAARYVDSVKKADYEKQQSGIIDTVIQNLILNSEALDDKYVTAEQIRFNDEVRDLMYQTSQLGRGFEGNQLEAAIGRNQNAISTKSTIQNSQIRKMLGMQGNNLASGLQTKTTNMAYRDNRDILRNNSGMAISKEGLSRDIRNENINLNSSIDKAFNNMDAAQSNRQAMTQVAAYMNSIKQSAIASNALLSQTENEGVDIQEQILLGEQIDTLERDAQYTAAITESAVRRNQAAVRQGGSNSSNKASLDAMQAFGRTYGEMRVQQKARRQRMTNFNASVQGEVAQQFAQFANTAQGLRDQMKGTQKLQKLRQNQYKFNDQRLEAQRMLGINNSNAEYNQNTFMIRQETDDRLTQLLNDKNGANALTELNRQNNNRNFRYDHKLTTKQARAQSKLTNYGINKGLGLEKQGYRAGYNNLKDIFNQSTLSGFRLGNRQGQREFQSLIQGAFNQVNQASTPYRDAIINDPLLPIAGLKPELQSNGKVYVPGTGSIVLDATFGAAKTVLDSAGTDAKGNLTFGDWAPWG